MLIKVTCSLSSDGVADHFRQTGQTVHEWTHDIEPADLPEAARAALLGCVIDTSQFVHGPAIPVVAGAHMTRVRQISPHDSIIRIRLPADVVTPGSSIDQIVAEAAIVIMQEVGRAGQLEELARHNVAVREAEERAAMAQRAEQAAAVEQQRLEQDERQRTRAEAATLERDAWIGQHGSERLRLAQQAGLAGACDPAYRDERLAWALPGWRRGEPDGDRRDIRNPSEQALRALLEWRRILETGGGDGTAELDLAWDTVEGEYLDAYWQNEVVYLLVPGGRVPGQDDR